MLNLLLVNVRSLNSVEKQREWHALFEQEDLDIVCGTKSHVDSHHFSSGIFPTTIDYFMKEYEHVLCCSVHCCQKYLLANQDDSMIVFYDSILVKIVFTGKQQLHTGSFYGPTNCDIIPLVKLDKSLN